MRLAPPLLALGLSACASELGPEDLSLTIAVPLDAGNALARVATVAADVPQGVVLTCAADGEVLAWERAEADTAHVFELTGLFPGAWTCTAVGARQSVRTTFELTASESGAPRVEGDVELGLWTAHTRRLGGLETRLVVYDPAGRPRLQVSLPPAEGSPSPGLYAEVLDDRLVAGGGQEVSCGAWDAMGRLVWPCAAAAPTHHDAELHPDDVVLLTQLDDGPEGGFGIEVLPWSGGPATWTWGSPDHLDDLPGEDPYHPNAVRRVSDAWGEGYWISARNEDALLRIDGATGALTHRLGEGGDFALLDAAGAPSDDWFLGQHDPQLLGDRVLVYDNGTAMRRPSSRVIELVLDPDAMTATLTRQWTEPGWFEPIMGGVHELDDGDWLVTRAHCAVCEGLGNGPDSDVVRVDPDTGEVRWRLVFEDAEVYRADVVDPCALFPATCAGP